MQESNCSISVLMPVYNAALHLHEAIESILRQDTPDMEFIILNDGSTDQSENIILSYTDPRIRYIKNDTNLGLIKTLNKGIELCRGKYIARMDSDDISLAGRFNTQYRFLESHPDAGAVGTAYYSFSENFSRHMHVFTEPGELASLLLFNSCLCHPSVMIRKSVLDKDHIRYSENSLHAEDYDFWITLSRVSKLYNINEPLLKYRYHAAQISLLQNDTQKENASKIRRSYLEGLGFTFTDIEYETHNLVAESRFITRKGELEKIEKWFLKLLEQNNDKKSLDKNSLEKILGKMWFDTCGHSNLGFTAFNFFFRSALSVYYPVSLKQKTKLGVKCLVRRFRS